MIKIWSCIYDLYKIAQKFKEEFKFGLLRCLGFVSQNPKTYIFKEIF